MIYIEHFLNHLESKHLSVSSIMRYKWILKKTKKYFDEKGIYDERQFSENHIAEYLKYLKSTGAGDTVYFYVILNLRVYFKYLEHEELIFISPMINVSLPKMPRNHIPIISHEKMLEVFEKIDTSNHQGLRARAVLELMYSSSIRPMEVCNIKLSDIDFINGIIFISQGKNKKDRLVPVGNEALSWINKYIDEVRGDYIRKKLNNYLFLSGKTGTKLTPKGLYKSLKNVFKANNIEWFKPYTLRPSSATGLLLNGMSLPYIQKLLGHSEINTTKIYLRVGTHDLKKALQGKHPAENRREILK